MSPNLLILHPLPFPQVEGKRIEDHEQRQARWRQMLQNRRARSVHAPWAELRYGIGSEASPPHGVGVAARERGPAVMASRPEPLDTQLVTT